MAETLQNLYLGFSVALTPSVLFYAFVGCVIGTLVGVLPGVGPLAGISLLLPATFGLSATNAIVLLMVLLGVMERKRPAVVMAVALGLSLGSFFLFSNLLKVPLPRGPWGL